MIKELALFPSSFFPGVNFGYANMCILTLEKSTCADEIFRNKVVVRTNFSTVDELPLSCSGDSIVLSQRTIYETVGSALILSSSGKVSELINDKTIKRIGDIAVCVTGFYSGNDKSYLHPVCPEVKNAKRYICADSAKVRVSPLSEKEKVFGVSADDFLVPIMKGGNVEYVKENLWFMDWSCSAVASYRKSKKCRFQNSDFYFREGIGIPMVRSSKLTAALIEGRLFDQSIVGVFPKDSELLYYLLAFFNSRVCSDMIMAINPSTNNSANYIKKIPFLAPSREVKAEVEGLVASIILRLKDGCGDIAEQKAALDRLFDDLYR